MATHLYNTVGLKPFVISEASGLRSRDEIVVTQAGDAVESGQLLAKQADGKYLPYAVDGSDGEATAVLYRRLPAATGDVKAVAIVRDAEVNVFELTNLGTTGKAELAAQGIIVRGKSNVLGVATPAL